MDKTSQEPASRDTGRLPAAGERVVLVMPPEAVLAESRDEVNLVELWSILWRGKWLVIGVATTFAALSVGYAFTAAEWYRAEVLLAPAAAKASQGLSGQLEGLASLAGINIGGGNNSAEPVAVLKSRDFARAFIEEQKLLPVLFADDWNARAGGWKSQDPDDWPEIRDAVKYFDEDIRRVQEDKKTGLVSVTIEWTDANVAAQWANLLVERVNDRMRQRSLVDAEANVGYLQRELAAANVVTLQQSIGRLLESELEKLMIARGNKEFAFRFIDRASAPKWHSRPKRVQIVVLAVVGGVLLSMLAVFMRHAIRRDRESSDNDAQPGVPSSVR